MQRKKVKPGIREVDVEKYEMLSPLLNSVLKEMKELSKKKQDGVLNKLKVDMANKILKQIKQLLSEEPTLEFIELLDEEILPTNSDAVFVLSQFRAALEQFNKRYYYWNTDELNSRWHTIEHP